MENCVEDGKELWYALLYGVKCVCVLHVFVYVLIAVSKFFVSSCLIFKSFYFYQHSSFCNFKLVKEFRSFAYTVLYYEFCRHFNF